MAEIPSFTPKTPVTRNYYSLAGVDFSTEPSIVQRNRSPESINMYKDYGANLGQAVETRCGFSTMLDLEDTIYGIHFVEFSSGLKVLVHAGTNLYSWSDYPEAQEKEEMTVLYSTMAENPSSSFVYNTGLAGSGTRLFINDGTNYLYYDNVTVASVENIADVPTTTIASDPSGANGSFYQDVNVLQPKRKNTFVADGNSRNYQLDAIPTSETVVAKVNGSTVSATANTTTGVVTFDTAPSTPTRTGEANVEIEFTREVSGYANRIKKCTLNCIYDNRVFFSGNSDFPNALFHCAVNTPTYIPDTAYYQDGSDNVSISSMIRIGDSLAVIKEDDQQENTVYYHTATESIDYKDGNSSKTTTYPSKQGLAGIGCISRHGARNFLDEPVFMSKRGLESITKLNLGLERASEHKSTTVDGKLTNEPDLENVYLEEWKGYLLCLVNGHIYLADNRQKYQNSATGTAEYEWYYWENIGTYTNNEFDQAIMLKEYDEILLFGTNGGKVCKFIPGQYNDDGRVIYSCWTTPKDDFGSINHLKTTNKRGGVANLKTIPNSSVKLNELTDKTDEKYITRFVSSGFDFGNIDFANFSFATGEDCFMKYKIKEKKWGQLQLIFYSDELNRPFGLFSATIEAFIGGYMKSVNIK